SAPDTNRARCPDSASSTDTTSFLNNPSPGRSPQWGHRPGSAPAPLDGAVAGLQETGAFPLSGFALLQDALFSMSWHDSHLPWRARPLPSGSFLACLVRCVTSP